MSQPPAAAPLHRSEAPNNFGAIRLVLAFLVILSHSPELVDGNRSRELLTRAFGTLSLGELAVDCFFVISGYLITKSYLSSDSAFDYLLKRVLRIYPAYVVAFVLCVFALAPLVGGAPGAYPGLVSHDSLIFNILMLNTPTVPGALAGLHYPFLNGSAWTIRYEFLAYLVVLVFGLLGLLRRRRLVLLLTLFLLVANVLVTTAIHAGIPVPFQDQFWANSSEIRFLGLFGVGALFLLYRNRIVYEGRYAMLAAVALVAALCLPRAASFGVATFGGYLLFYAASQARWPWVSAIGRRNDISYGVYLYAWPAAVAILWFDRDINPWWLFVQTSVVAAGLGWVSWLVIERPATRRLAKRFFPPRLISSSDTGTP